MSKEKVKALFKGKFSLWLNMGLVLVAVSVHVLLLTTSGEDYAQAVRLSFSSIGSLCQATMGQLKVVYAWCFQYTGWFLFPLAACVAHSGWTLFKFLEADRQNTPLSKQVCERWYDSGIYFRDLAAILGFAGTMIYIIAGLGLMAKAMVGMSATIAGGAGATGGVADLPFDQLAQAAMFLVPALGTSFVPLISEAMINHVERIMKRWGYAEWSSRRNSDDCSGTAGGSLEGKVSRKDWPIVFQGKPVSMLAKEIMKRREERHET